MIELLQDFDPYVLAWLQALPKVELHLHLEGAIPLDALWQLVEKYGNPDRLEGPAELEARFQFKDFPHFIETWIWKNGYLREYEDFTHISRAVAEDLASQNLRYAEVYFSPSDFAAHGLQPQGLATAIRKGLDQVHDIKIALIADLVRDIGPEASNRVLSAVNEVKDQGIIGIGIGGSEQNFPPEPYAPVYERARNLSFRTTAHAGEADGPESVWGAIRALKVDRIGHATRAPEDPSLVSYLAAQQVSLEMNPWSNVCTGVINDISQHPIKIMRDVGCLISVNTDDPKMFGNSLAEEYALMMQTFDFTAEDIKDIILNGLRTSWLDTAGKQRFISAFKQESAWGR